MSIYHSPEFAAFIAEIRAMPDDDLPRLVCADWLEEHGNAERAEFIRCQVWAAQLERGRLPVKVVDMPYANVVFHSLSPGSSVGAIFEFNDGKYGEVRSLEVARSVFMRDRETRLMGYNIEPAPPCPTRDRWRALKSREGELWHGKLAEGIGPLMLRELPNADVVKLSFELADVRRGFLERLRIRGADWIAHADAILRVNPVRRVTFVIERDTEYKRWTKRWCKVKWPGVEFTFERETERGTNFAAVMGQMMNERLLAQYLGLDLASTPSGYNFSAALADHEAFTQGGGRG